MTVLWDYSLLVYVGWGGARSIITNQDLANLDMFSPFSVDMGVSWSRIVHVTAI